MLKPVTEEQIRRALANLRHVSGSKTEDIEVAAVRASLECGTFKALRPDLDMISIGPDLSDAHTPGETLCLDSVPKVWHLLEGILPRVS